MMFRRLIYFCLLFVITISMIIVVTDCITIPPELTGTEIICDWRPLHSLSPIPSSLTSIQRVMASIYNAKGRYLYQEAIAAGYLEKDLAAVLRVESNDKGFDSNTRKMIIRFENHVFYREYTNDGTNVVRVATFNDHYKYDATTNWQGHEWRASINDPWISFHGNQILEWQVLVFSQNLDDTAAIRSISMGAPQIMGFNFASIGYTSEQEMFLSFSISLRAHLDGLITFIRTHSGCNNGLLSSDYLQFATCYNGAGKAATYAAAIEEAANAYETVVNSLCISNDDNDGFCVDTTTYSCDTGTLTSGLCSNPTNNIQCCTISTRTSLDNCEIFGLIGNCIDKTLCSYQSFTGFCPGASNIQCCIDGCPESIILENSLYKTIILCIIFSSFISTILICISFIFRTSIHKQFKNASCSGTKRNYFRNKFISQWIQRPQWMRRKK